MKLKSEEKFDRHLDTIRIGRNVCFGGGGGQSQPSSTTTLTSNLPTYLEPYVTRNVASAEAVANKPYEAYSGQRIAEFNPNQHNVQSGIMGLQTPGQYGQATQATQGVMGGSWTDPGVASQFMNPYQQSVTDIAKREATRQAGIQGTKRDAQFATAGAFGGSRQGIADAEAQRNLMQQQNDIQMQGSNQAYQQGMGQYNAQQGLQLQGANQLASLGGQQQQADLARYGAQAGVGQQQQAQTQQQQDLAYQDFINQRDYGKTQAGWMSGLLHGATAPIPTSSQTTLPAPNVASQLTGIGIAGLGAYNASKV